MKTVPVCLIEKNLLFAEGLKSLLMKTDFKVVEAYPDLHLAIKTHDGGDDIALVICSVDSDVLNTTELINSLKMLYPLCRIAILSSNTDIEFITSCFSAGADGYFNKDIAPDSLLNSLNMIMAGERICPAFVLTMWAERKSKEHTGEADHDLSDRELDILEHLANGETNKQIAIHSDITEATVKVHVKAILRKLGLSNRTQAAIWAFNNGVADHLYQKHPASSKIVEVVDKGRP